jgi:hypothetical protein
MTPLATAGDPATTAAIRPVTERRGSIHGGDVRGAGDDAARAAAHALIACNVYLRYPQIAVVEGGPRLGIRKPAPSQASRQPGSQSPPAAWP